MCVCVSVCVCVCLCVCVFYKDLRVHAPTCVCVHACVFACVCVCVCVVKRNTKDLRMLPHVEPQKRHLAFGHCGGVLRERERERERERR